jgi:hypothetical protein
MKDTQPMKSTKGILGFICGSLLVGVPVIALTSVAMPLSQVNPDSSLLSEAPSNLDSTNTPRNTPARTTTVAPPLPEQLQSPSAIVVPVNGTVNIKLVNQTYTDVTYQVIGETETRTLPGRSEVTLQTLKTPVNLTLHRPDRGFLLVRPESSEAGMLEVSLSETTDLGIDKTAMTIQENGNVFLN